MFQYMGTLLLFIRQQIAPPANSERIKDYFCLDTVFDLSRKVLSQTEISILDKGLRFVPASNMIHEADFRLDFNQISRKMWSKWYFRDEPSKAFSKIPTFRSKTTWKPPASNLCVELFLDKMEHVLFSFLLGNHKVKTLLRRNGKP